MYGLYHPLLDIFLHYQNSNILMLQTIFILFPGSLFLVSIVILKREKKKKDGKCCSNKNDLEIL